MAAVGCLFRTVCCGNGSVGVVGDSGSSDALSSSSSSTSAFAFLAAMRASAASRSARSVHSTNPKLFVYEEVRRACGYEVASNTAAVGTYKHNIINTTETASIGPKWISHHGGCARAISATCASVSAVCQCQCQCLLLVIHPFRMSTILCKVCMCQIELRHFLCRSNSTHTTNHGKPTP